MTRYCNGTILACWLLLSLSSSISSNSVAWASLSDGTGLATDLTVTRNCGSEDVTDWDRLESRFANSRQQRKRVNSVDIEFSYYAKLVADNTTISNEDLVQQLQSLMLDRIASSVLSCQRLATLLPQREAIDDVMELRMESALSGGIRLSDPESPCFGEAFAVYELESHRCHTVQSTVHLQYLNPYDEFQIEYEILQALQWSMTDDLYLVPALQSRVLTVGFMGPDPTSIQIKADHMRGKSRVVHHLVTLTVVICAGMLVFVVGKAMEKQGVFQNRNSYPEWTYHGSTNPIETGGEPPADNDDATEVASNRSASLPTPALLRDWKYGGGNISFGAHHVAFHRSDSAFYDTDHTTTTSNSNKNRASMAHPDQDVDDDDDDDNMGQDVVSFYIDRSGMDEHQANAANNYSYSRHLKGDSSTVQGIANDLDSQDDLLSDEEIMSTTLPIV